MLGWNEEIKKELGACGQNVFIGHNVMFARPKEVFLGDNVRIDPFALINCGLVAEGNNQLSSHTIMNGRKTVHLGEWVGFGYRVTVLTGSEDFTGEFGPANDWFGKNKSFENDVVFETFSNALTNSLILPGCIIPEGAVIGANAVVRPEDELHPYWIHAMRPKFLPSPFENSSQHRVKMTLQAFRERNQKNILKFAREWRNENQE